MEGLLSGTDFRDLVAAWPRLEKFTVVDVGCSFGIDAAWRGFGDKLVAYGFDPNLGECARLQAAESLRGVHYIPAFVGVPDDLPYKRLREGRGPWSRSVWDRLSVAKSLAGLNTKAMSDEEKTVRNQWSETNLADPDAPILLRDFLPSRGVTDVDLLKIDIDSVDFGVLQSIRTNLVDWRVLAVGLEVNYYGSDDDSDHTFHAMDRFMRAQGFDLYGLTVRHYSHAALPAPYLLSVPAQTTFGRPLQGDAIYLRDLGADEVSDAWAPQKLVKLAAIASLCGVPDFGAEILVKNRKALAEIFDVQRGLDLLAAQAQPNVQTPLTYAEYISAFESNDPMFYPQISASNDSQITRRQNDQRLEELQTQLADLQKQIAAIKKSASWRLTSPLRHLTKAIGLRSAR